MNMEALLNIVPLPLLSSPFTCLSTGKRVRRKLDAFVAVVNHSTLKETVS